MMYKLQRKEDGLVKNSSDVKWVEFGSDGRAKEMHDSPDVGRSLIFPPFNSFYEWMTTPITEVYLDTIINQEDDAMAGVVHFKTKNSEYILTKVK